MSHNTRSYHTTWDDDGLDDRSLWFNSMDSAFGSYGRPTRHGPFNLTHHRFHPSRFPGGWDAWRNVPNEWQALLVEYSEPLLRADFFGEVHHMCAWLHHFFHRWFEGYPISPHALREARHWLKVLAQELEVRSELYGRGSWIFRAAIGLWDLRSWLPRHPELYYDDFEHWGDWDRQLGLPWGVDMPGHNICRGHGVPFERHHRRLPAPRLPTLPPPVGPGMGGWSGRSGRGYDPMDSLAPFPRRRLPGISRIHDGKTLRRGPYGSMGLNMGLIEPPPIR